MAGLKRIILIDTHLPGVVELKLDGHTNICGTNASGKTTLQRLIPVFYGEYPSRVVPATRDSFEKWYLPRESSFIIYEYIRSQGDLCQAVMASSGGGVNYRFIAKPFELTDYLYQNKSKEHASISMNELARNLKRNHTLVTNLLNTRDYRAILQNDRATLGSVANSRELLGYASIFSMTESGIHLRHIEKLAKAVHSKEGKMETIKAMIAAILEEDGVKPPSSSLSRNRVEDWIKECHLIKEFDSIRPEFAKLEQADHQLQQNEQRLGLLKHQFAVDESTLSAMLVEKQQQLDDTLHTLKTDEQQWSNTQDTLNQQLSEARADANKLEKELDNVEREFENWQSQDIDTLKDSVQKLGQWQSEISTLSTRYNLLTEKHQDIESAFNKRMRALSEKHLMELEAFDEEKQNGYSKLAQQKSEQQESLQAIRDEYRLQLNEVEKEYSARLNELKIQHAEIAAALNNMGFTEFEQSQLDLLDAEIKEAGMVEDASRDNHRRAHLEYESAVKARAQANSALEKTSIAYQAQQAQVDKVEALLYPGNNSLLEYLRREKAGWESTLGKVIHPDLLARDDLKPQVGDEHDSLFGLMLDLAPVDTPPYADSEQALQNRLAQAQNKLAEKLSQQNDAEAELAKASESVRNAELMQARYESENRSAEANRKRVQLNKDQVQKEYLQAVGERRKGNQARVTANAAEQEKCQAQHKEAMQEVRDQQREAETEHQFHWQQLITDSEDKLRQIERHILKAKDSAKEDKQKTEQWLADELANRGVDIDEIGSLQKAINQLQQDINHTERHRHKVSDYDHWYKNVFMGHKVTWQQGLAKARKESAKAERELERQGSEYKNKRQQLKELQAQIEQHLNQAREQENDVQQIIRQLGKINLPVSTEMNEQSKSAVSIGQRISEGLTLLQERQRLLDDIKAHVEHFDQLIAAQAGTGLSDTWERSREECAVITTQGHKSVDHRRLVSHLAQLLNVIVPQKLQGLREQGRIFGADLTSYYRVLEDIDKRIVNQSKRISKEVDEELFLDGVSHSAVKIRSRISELEFWPELTQFNLLYEEWLASGKVELPDDDYALSMRRVLDILGRAALTGGISKLLDIELHLKEGNSELVIRTDRQLNESSSHGMAYLILCKFLLAFTRLLRGKANTTIHWPIDELGTLHQNNVKKIFDACQNNNISVVGAFPNPESEVLSLFDNRYLIDKATRKLQVVQPRVSAISELIKQRQQEASA
ncbi:ATP-binding protein [Alteromonas pelagimontana]|uniref:ATP-binding protein n=1 Tax=Alteromonas pelagimontana TaxID=1858656 RepID=A0A6M4MBD3_9ALTE|nr:ATP-binding protein [Alteromonas pelagimontana]QJR79855.1 ATP-binding protein [Alteromonas pelagimontana]